MQSRLQRRLERLEEMMAPVYSEPKRVNVYYHDDDGTCELSLCGRITAASPLHRKATKRVAKEVQMNKQFLPQMTTGECR